MKVKTKKPKKTFSLAFLLGIPSSLLLSLLNFINLGMLIKTGLSSKESWLYFGAGALFAAALTISFKLPRLRVFIHELKHAVVIILTGNKLTNFKVNKHTGQVTYTLYKDKLKFAPLITIAPYFLPLFSVPCLLVCLIFGEGSLKLPLSSFLGLTLALDFILGFQEIHPHQTDINKMFGGILLVGLFIVTAQLMWGSVCFIWVSGGLSAYLISGETSFQLIKEVLKACCNLGP